MEPVFRSLCGRATLSWSEASVPSGETSCSSVGGHSATDLDLRRCLVANRSACGRPRSCPELIGLPHTATPRFVCKRQKSGPEQSACESGRPLRGPRCPLRLWVSTSCASCPGGPDKCPTDGETLGRRSRHSVVPWRHRILPLSGRPVRRSNARSADQAPLIIPGGHTKEEHVSPAADPGAARTNVRAGA